MCSIMTGEKLQLLCDHFICTMRSFKYNKNISAYENKVININDINSNINNKSIIFCYTDVLQNINFLINKLNYLDNQFVLMFHNSDYNFDEKHLLLF